MLGVKVGGGVKVWGQDQGQGQVKGVKVGGGSMSGGQGRVVMVGGLGGGVRGAVGFSGGRFEMKRKCS